MIKFIEGNINQNRELTFEEIPVYEGEQYAHALKIPIDIWENSGVDFYSLTFETYPFGNRFQISPVRDETGKSAYIENDFIICPLTSEMTSKGKLKIQLSAHKLNENGIEIIEKTSVCRLEFKSSLPFACFNPVEFKTLEAEFWGLKNRLDYIQNELDYDYFCAAMGAKFLYLNRKSTPVYFPKTGEETDALAESILENYVPDGMVTHYIVAPAYGDEAASLIVIYTVEGSAVLGRYSGKGILELMMSEVKV